MTADSPDLVIAKRLLDHVKAQGFQFSALPKAPMGRCWAPGTWTNGQTPSISTGSAAVVMRCASAEAPCSCRAAGWSSATLPAAR